MLRKFTYAFSLTITLFVMTTSIVVGQTPKLSDADRKLITDTLNLNRANFEKAVAGLSTEQLNFKAAPDKWSILECAEHITEAEPFLLNLITNTILKTPAATDQKSAASDTQIASLVNDRSRKFQAPEPIKPTGKWKTIDETTKEFGKRRENTITYVKTTDISLRNHLWGFNEAMKWDGVQWFIYMSGHVDRHISQINEVKANPNFPKK